jgi:hypothetical protein
MYEALCRPSGTTLDIVHDKGGPPFTQRTLGLGLPDAKAVRTQSEGDDNNSERENSGERGNDRYNNRLWRMFEAIVDAEAQKK